MILIIGYVLLSLLVVTVVAAASSVYVEHKRLLSLADGASLAAADSFTLGQVDSTAATPSAVLSNERVKNVVHDYLNRNASFDRFNGLTVAGGTGTADNRTAAVVLTAVVHPPIVNFLVPDGIPITATSTARSQLRR
jgi:hypothetical protein